MALKESAIPSGQSNGEGRSGSRAYEEILASELSYRRLFEAAQDGILILDAETGRVEDVNPFLFNLLGFSRAEMVGKTVGELSPFKDVESNQAMLERLQEQGYIRYENLPMEARDGRKMAVEFVSNVYQVGEKNVIQCNIRDITARKRSEEHFLRVQRMESIGTLAGGIAHDLNNVLLPIMMSIEVLKTMSDDPAAIKILDTIETSAQQAADIIQQILSLAHGLEGDGVERYSRHFLKDLQKIIKDTFPKDIQLQFSVTNNPWTILGDPAQIRDILLNLCFNASQVPLHLSGLTIGVENRELDEQYGNLRLRATVSRHVNIEVTADINLQPEMGQKIFEPFFLPTETIKDMPQIGGMERGNGETILVVDDEASILVITSQTLQAFGYRTLTAKDGADAVAVYAQNRNEISVVLMDMMMPVMEGLDAIKVLRRLNPEVRIVASSGLHAKGPIAAAAGIKHFLPKPYTPDILFRTIRAILEEPASQKNC